MATYFASSSNQREGASMRYFRESLPGSYPEAPVPPGNVMMYMNSGSYSDALAASSQQQNNCIDIQSMEASGSTPQQQEIFSNLGGTQSGEHEFNAWRDNRNDMLVMHPMGGSTGMLHSGHNLQGQGLSLSLGTQIPSGIQMPSISYRNPNSGFASFLGSNSSISADGGRNGSSRDEQTRTTEYFPPGISGGNQDGKGDLSPYGMPCTARASPSSKYLKAAQQLLDEVVNVRKDLKQPDGEKIQTTHEQQMKNSKDGDGGLKDASSNAQESASNTPNELSHAEIQELQNKLTKLLSMLDEVDRRYKHYYHQMQIVVSSFDVIAGCGAAKPYTALALQTISRHFRCLRDAICCQIRVTRKSLGEQDNSDNSKGITRLRYVDQQLRQQRAIQQLGMMQQHAWRPQRGLPESSVSILRAWLFEHFLHPYPKDSDKILLARQTGLTRSQVSNWFINARVRLWKPMVEEMYKEEFADEEMDSNSSSENVAKAIRGDMGTSEDRDEDLQQSGGSTATERCSSGQLTESKSGHIPEIEMTGASFQNGTGGEAETEYGLPKLREEQRLGFDDQNIFPNPMVPSDGSNDRFMAAAYHRHMSELGRFGSGSGVSLTLGLQHCEGGSLPMAGAAHQDFFAMGGDEIYQAAASSVGTDTVDYEYINNESRQSRFSSSHLLHDFIA